MKNNKKVWIITTIAILAIALTAAAAGVLIIRGGQGRFNRLLEMGQVYLEDGDYDRALAAFEEAWHIDPKNPDLYDLIGEAYALKNAPLEAVDMLILADAAFSPPAHEYKIAEIQNKVSSGEYTQEDRVSRQTDSFYKESSQR